MKVKNKSIVSIMAKGNSMNPMIKNNCLLIINKNVDTYARGDIVLFKKNGSVLAHRIISIIKKPQQTQYIIKGDNHHNIDGLFNKSIIEGKVEKIISSASIINLNNPFYQLLNKYFVFDSIICLKYLAFKKYLKSLLLKL